MPLNTFRVKENYLEYMSGRVSFKGLSNRRKTLVLWSLYSLGKATGRRVYEHSGDCSYSALRSSISRLLGFGYIGQAGYSATGAYIYSLRAKGYRFLYAASKIAPEYKRWLAEAQDTKRVRCE